MGMKMHADFCRLRLGPPSPTTHPLGLEADTRPPAIVCFFRSKTNIEAVYHQLAMLRSKLAATAAANTDVPASEAAEGTQTENALLTLVEANVRVVEGQR